MLSNDFGSLDCSLLYVLIGRLISDELESRRKRSRPDLRRYLGRFLNELRNIMTNLLRYPVFALDFNPGRSEYKAEVLIVGPRLSVTSSERVSLVAGM